MTPGLKVHGEGDEILALCLMIADDTSCSFDSTTQVFAPTTNKDHLSVRDLLNEFNLEFRWWSLDSL